MTDELKPCPFCGHKEIDPRGWASADKHGPACDWCGATAETTVAWNLRDTTAEARLAAVVERLKIFREDNAASEINLKNSVGGKGLAFMKGNFVQELDSCISLATDEELKI